MPETVKDRQQNQAPHTRLERAPSAHNQLRLGLALSGGAARGLAHVGVLKVLVEHGIEVHSIAGTSAGALVGGGFAAGITPAELVEMSQALRWRGVGRMTFSRGGFQTNLPFEEFIRARIPITRFEDLRIPFAAVATDLNTGDPVVMSGHGDVPFAIRASCTVPGLYVPVVDGDGRQLIDGGLVANIPIDAARALGADIIVAVDVNSEGAKFLGAPQSMLGVLMQSLILVQRTIAVRDLRYADLAIRPRVGHIRWDEMTRGEELIRAGEEAMRESVDDLKRLLEKN